MSDSPRVIIFREKPKPGFFRRRLSNFAEMLVEKGFYTIDVERTPGMRQSSAFSYDPDLTEKGYFPGPGGTGFIGAIPERPIYPYPNLDSHYETNPWVFHSVDVISNAVAALPIKLYKEQIVGGKPKRREVLKHDALTLLRRPNELTTGRSYKKSMASDAVMYGEAWQYTDDGTAGKGAKPGKPTSLRLFKPQHIAPIPDPLKLISGYEYMHNSSAQKLAPHYIAAMKTWNPRSDYRGMPPMQVAKESSLLQYYMRRYNKKFFENGTFFGLYMWTEKVLNDIALGKLKAHIKDEYGGGVDNANKFPILHGGFQVGNATTNAKDGEFIGISKWGREETLAVFGVPPVAVGVMEFANYANTWQQMKMFYELTVMPLCEMISDMLTYSWLRVFWPEETDLYAQFDYSDVKFLGEEAESADRIASSQTRDGRITINEWRAENDLPPVDWGDDPPASFSGAFGLSDSLGPSEKQRTQKNIEKRLWTCKSSYDVRRARWAAINKRVEADMPLYSKIMIKHWAGQKERVLSTLRGYEASGIGRIDVAKRYPTAEDLFDNDYEAKQLYALAKPVIAKVVERAAKQRLLDIKSDVTFNVLDPNVVTWIQNRSFKMANDISRNTQKAIRQIVIDGISTQQTIDQIAGRITTTYEDFERYRALRVARHQAAGAQTGGAIEGYAQGGIEKKGWAAVIDDATRESHVGMDGEVVPLREEFSNGLMGPGVSGSEGFKPEEEINCRCAMYAEVD